MISEAAATMVLNKATYRTQSKNEANLIAKVKYSYKTLYICKVHGR